MAERPLRVVFDGHAMSPQRSGIGEYSAALLKAFFDAGADIDLHVYASGRIHPCADYGDVLTATAEVRDGSLYDIRHQLEVPKLLRGGGYDVFHTPDFLLPYRARNIAIVSTIHDLIPLVMHRFLRHSLKVRLLPLFRLALRMSVRRAHAIITVSEHSRRDMQRLLRVDTASVDAIPAASTLPVVGGPLRPPFDTQLQPGRYMLYVGRHDPYKGIGLMLKAFRDARDRAGWGDLRLVIAGKEDPRYPVRPTIEALGLQDTVTVTGFITQEQLSALHSNALALVMPSLYEGFGVPVLDAMQHATAVVCSDRASLPEVAGDAALLVDPEDEEAFTSALVAVYQDHTLRDELISRGLERARQFSWDATASETVKVYRKAVARR